MQTGAGTRTKREAVITALEEYVRRQRSRELRGILGTFESFMTSEELERQRNGGTAERAKLTQLFETLVCLPTEAKVWSQARELAGQSRKRGVTVPATDILIAAVAEAHQISLLHADRHFDLLSGGS